MFICHTLMMLQDAGMSFGYPKICYITLNEEGKSMERSHISYIQGRQVSIEQNPQMKFLMLFTLLDFHVDASYPDLEGKSYRQKYLKIPSKGDYNLILRQLFRIAKVIRNALIHNPSSFTIANGNVSVNYIRDKQHFSLKMSREAFKDFHTAIVMYVKGDIGKGSYFLGIMRSVYESILFGITQFNDEFGCVLEKPMTGITIKQRGRQIVLHPVYETYGGALRFPSVACQISEWEGMDFYFIHNGTEYLVPREALDKNLSITEDNLIANWKREGHYPHIKVP